MSDATDHSMFIFGISIRTWSLVFAVPCVTLACFVSFLSMLRHCKLNQDKVIRRHLLRILFMVPLYGINALMALLWPFNVEIFTLLRETYEAVTIYSLSQFLFAYLGGENRLRYLLSLEDQAEDEYHLYRLAQNLANKDVISLPNKNFVQEQVTHTINVDTTTLNRYTHDHNIISHDNTTHLYSSRYKLQEYEHNKPWYKKLPFIRTFFPPPDFYGKTTFAQLPQPRANKKDVNINEQQYSKNNNNGKKNNKNELKAPLLTPSSSSNSPTMLNSSSASINNNDNNSSYGTIDSEQYSTPNDTKTTSTSSTTTKTTSRSKANTVKLINQDNNTLSFQTRPNINHIQATDEDRTNYMKLKELRQQNKQLSNNSNSPAVDLDDLGTIDTTTTNTNNTVLTQNINHNDDGNDDDEISLGRSHYTIEIATSPPGESMVDVEIDQNHPNRLIDHNQQVLIHEKRHGENKNYLQDYHQYEHDGQHNNITLLHSTNLSESQIAQQRIVTLEYHPQLAAEERVYAHIFPCNYFLKAMSANRFLFISKFSILQYVPVQIICAIFVLIGHFGGFYHPGSWKANNLYPYISVILNTSQIFAMYGLFLFLHHFSANLKPINAISKALTIKAVVFATFWQSTAITLYYMFFPWCSHESAEPRRCEEGEWDSQEQAAGINNFLICCEMFAFALIHLRVFSWREFGRKLMYDSTKPVLRSVIEFFSPEDIMLDVKRNVTLGNFKSMLIAPVHQQVITSPQPVVVSPSTTIDTNAFGSNNSTISNNNNSPNNNSNNTSQNNDDNDDTNKTQSPIFENKNNFIDNNNNDESEAI